MDFSTYAIFHDPAIFELEAKTLFLNDWTLVGMMDQVRGPDTWCVHESWSRSIVIGRDREGCLHAFVNSCAHRGTRLCKPGEMGSGRIQCPYHGWVYDSSGRLIEASDPSGLPAFDKEHHGLIRLPVQQVGQFIFANGSPNPSKTLHEALGPLVPVLQHLLTFMSKPVFVKRFLIKANWKLAVSGAIEDYHAPVVHRTSFAKRRVEPAVPSLRAGGHSSFVAPMADATRRKLIIENDLVFPNTLLIRIGGFVHVTSYIPVTPALTLRISRLYNASPKRRRLRRLMIPIVRRRIEQGYREDQDAVEEAQIGTGMATDRRPGPEHAEEVRVGHFLKEVSKRSTEQVRRTHA